VGPRTGEDPEAEEENAAGLRKVENFMRAAAGERFSLRAIRAGAGVRHGTERGLVDSLVERGLVRREGDKWYFDPNCAGRSR
jgi:DNA-binding IclR family transcriptional regulator